jgi:hypothetical protein
MSKSLTFAVTLNFESKITDDKDILEIAKNIARALVNEANSGNGLTTESSNTYTESVEVKPQYLDEIVTLKVVQ